MSQLQVTGEAKIRDIQGPVVANSGVITALDGAANQYVRGDGTLASFPTSGGGGSSVSYYLNGSVNQGTFAGSTYYEMSEDAIIGTGTNFSTSTNGLIAQFITDVNVPDVTEIPSGNWNVEFFMGVSASSGALASFYVEIYKWDGTTFTLIATNVATPEQLTNTTTVDAYFTSVAMPTTALSVTDRLAVRIFVNVAGKTVTLYTEDNRLCQIVTTFSKGVTSINNLTDQSQYLTTGTSGTDFNIVSSGDTHTFNIPSASNNNRGLITNLAQTIGGIKTFSSNINADSGIRLKNGVAPSANGYVGIGSNTQGLTLGVYDSGSAYYHELYFPYTNGYEYTFPSTSGTLALLEGTQTFSGAKTFTSTFGTQFDYGIYSPLTSKFDQGIIFLKGTVPTIFSTITTNLYTESTSNNLVIQDQNSKAKLLFDNSTQTYTFPNASGTIALTSNLSSYVPYTGATGNVDLGIYNIFSSFVYAEGAGGSTNGGILIKQYSGALAANSGYTSLFATPNQLGINFSGVYNTFLQSATLTASRTFTLPDLSGTFAMLEAGTQTFTGTVNVLGSLGTKFGISIEKGNTPSPLSANDIFIYASSGATNIVNFANSSYNATLSFPSSNQTYTFPAATGTIALTSNLSSYVPYTGATTNVDLGSNSITLFNITSNNVLIVKNTGSVTGTNGFSSFSGNLANNGFTFAPNNSSYHRFIVPTSSNYDYTLPSGSGTIALTSNLSAYVPYSGATGNVDLGSNYIISSSIVFWKGTGSGLGNIGIGRIFPLGQNTTGQVNIGIGENSLFFNTTGSNNIALGGSANGSNTTGSSNIGIGSSANYANTTASNNIAIGLGALANNTVDNNVAIGHVASYFNTTGNFNVAIGHATLYTNTTGSSNTAIGSNALYSTTTGVQNTAIGKTSMFYNTTGGSNTAIGTASLQSNTTGSSNTGIGTAALGSNTTGIGNIAIGNASGFAIITGSNNTIIGNYAGTSAMSNNIVLADGAGNIRYQWNGTNNVFGNPISGTSATFAGNVTIRPATGYNAYFQVNSTAFRTNYLNDALTTNISAEYRAEDFVWQNNLGQQRIKLFTSGNLIIGQDNTDAGYKLDVSGTARVTGSVTAGSTSAGANVNVYSSSYGNNGLLQAFGTDGVMKLQMGALGNSEAFIFANTGCKLSLFSGGSTTMTLTSGGRVGIGTDIPSEKLDVIGGAVAAGNGTIRTGITYSSLGLIGTFTNHDLGIITNGTERMRITSGGNVTINNSLTMSAYSYASSAIQFTRAASNSVTPASGNGILVFAGGNAQMRMDTSNGINFDMNNGGSPYTVLKLQQNGNTVVVNSPDNSLPLAIAYQGTIHGYMGAASSALYAYSTNGGYVYLSSSSTWVPASDAKRKRNFEKYNLGLDAILGLKPKRYNMDFQKDGDEKQVGLVAQEVKECIPQAFEQNEDFIGINYNVIIVTLVNAIQEQQAQINELKSLINK